MLEFRYLNDYGCLCIVGESIFLNSQSGNSSMYASPTEKIPKLKVAFVGGSVRSAVGSAHYTAICLSDAYELVAGVFSRNPEDNRETGETFRVPPERTYSNLENLIKAEKGRIDAAVVLTPTDMHFDHVTTLLDNDIPVICEKALVSSLKEAEKIRELLQARQGFLAVIYNYLGYPMIRELKKMVRDGRFGKISQLRLEMPQETFLRTGPKGKPLVQQDWRLRDGEITTVSLDLGVHLHMFLHYLMEDEPVHVVARRDSLGNFPKVVDTMDCIIELASGVSCNMWYSKAAIGHRNGMRIQIYGDKGSAEWAQEAPEYLKVSTSDGTRFTVDRASPDVSVCNQPRYSRFKAGHPGGFIEAYANYYQDVATSLIAYSDSGKMDLNECYGIKESILGLRLFAAVEQSCKSKSWEQP